VTPYHAPYQCQPLVVSLALEISVDAGVVVMARLKKALQESAASRVLLWALYGESLAVALAQCAATPRCWGLSHLRLCLVWTIEDALALPDEPFLSLGSGSCSHHHPLETGYEANQWNEGVDERSSYRLHGILFD
jgi:hypothetical protein